MPFPIVPVLITAGLGTLGYALFKPDAPASGSGSSPAPAPAAGGGTLQPVNADNPLPGNLRPSNTQIPGLIKPSPTPTPKRPPAQPIPIPPSAQPIPIPPPGVLPPLPPSPIPIPPAILPTPTPVEPNAQTGTVIAPSGVNLRSAPNTSGTVMFGMIRGTVVKILSYDPTPTSGAPKGWYRVTAPNGMTGFATAEFIQTSGNLPQPPGPTPTANDLANLLQNTLNLPQAPVAPPSPSPSAGLTATVLGTPGANLRSSPSTSGAIIVGLFNGNKVSILNPIPTPGAGSVKGWFNVRSPAGQTGWMAADFLKVDGLPGFGNEIFRGRRKHGIRA